jgi:acetyltransferase-like isoleucine patch superfamily enzyme/dTDP-4-dehydrorhamnose 3,5-epimerase-like enzyme
MNYFVHPSAICESKKIGEKTRVWAFTHILPNAKIGSECNVCDHVFIENDVVIGDRVTIKCGVQVWDGVSLEDDVFIGPNVTFTNDPFPRSKQYPTAFSKTLVRRGASIGANATILSGITIGIQAMVGAGAVVTHDVPPYAKVVGNPARIIGYTHSHAQSVSVSETGVALGGHATAVKGVNVYELPLVKDLRGNLSVGEFERSVPFLPQRYFLVFDVPSGKVRGEHAHKQCHQFLICIKGSCAVVADDGIHRQEMLLDRPNKGVHLPPMTWGVQYKYSTDAILLVFASDYYDAGDYIRDYDEFMDIVNAAK